MIPLIIIATFIIGTSYARPGGNFNSPTPTASATPPTISNLATRSPSIAPSVFNLPSPTPSLAPQILRFSSPAASLAPQILNIPSPTASAAPFLLNAHNPTPSIAPLHYLDQYAPAVVNIGGQSLGQNLGFQSLGFQNFGLGYPVDLALPNQRQNFIQPGFNFGGQFLPFGLSQFPVEYPSLNINPSPLSVNPPLPITPSPLPTTPVPDIGVTASQLNAGFQNPVIQKHIYVHVAPEELEQRAPPKVVLPPPRIHYRIIFIKAPTTPPPVIQAPVQDEERTVIYVLVKKPEEEQQIEIQTPPTTTPSKPEVYFIKYNTRKESVASESVPSGPVAAEGEKVNLPIIEERAGGSGADRNVALDLNKASLTGGSALSLAVTVSPDVTTEVSSTLTPRYGPPDQK